MPIAKSVRDRRIAEGKCELCENTAELDPKTGKRRKHCRSHLDYFSKYKKTWRRETAALFPKVKKCSACREVGHQANDPKCPKYGKPGNDNSLN